MRPAIPVPPAPKRRTRPTPTALLTLAVPLLLVGGGALAQKFPGPAAPQPVRPARPIPSAPFGEPVAPQNNPAVEQQAAALPLDPATREMRDAVPADVPGIERQLGLREPRGPRTDLRGRTPSPQEIADALAPR